MQNIAGRLRAISRLLRVGVLVALPVIIAACNQNGGGGPGY